MLTNSTQSKCFAQLPPAEARLLAVIATFSNRHNEVFVSDTRLATEIGCSKRQVKRLRHSLGEKGILETISSSQPGVTPRRRIHLNHVSPGATMSPGEVLGPDRVLVDGKDQVPVDCGYVGGSPLMKKGIEDETTQEAAGGGCGDPREAWEKISRPETEILGLRVVQWADGVEVIGADEDDTAGAFICTADVTCVIDVLKCRRSLKTENVFVEFNGDCSASIESSNGRANVHPLQLPQIIDALAGNDYYTPFQFSRGPRVWLENKLRSSWLAEWSFRNHEWESRFAQELKDGLLTPRELYNCKAAHEAKISNPPCPIEPQQILLEFSTFGIRQQGCGLELFDPFDPTDDFDHRFTQHDKILLDGILS